MKLGTKLLECIARAPISVYLVLRLDVFLCASNKVNIRTASVTGQDRTVFCPGRQGGERGQKLSFSQYIIQYKNKKSWLSYATLLVEIKNQDPFENRRAHNDTEK